MPEIKSYPRNRYCMLLCPLWPNVRGLSHSHLKNWSNGATKLKYALVALRPRTSFRALALNANAITTTRPKVLGGASALKPTASSVLLHCQRHVSSATDQKSMQSPWLNFVSWISGQKYALRRLSIGRSGENARVKIANTTKAISSVTLSVIWHGSWLNLPTLSHKTALLLAAIKKAFGTMPITLNLSKSYGFAVLTTTMSIGG